jgi:hypothetical protein
MNTSHEIYNLLQAVVSSLLLGHNILLRILFSNNIQKTTSEKMEVIRWKQKA